ncbi:hypothetical protein T08_2408, partial [Trichinella sp. T8]
MRSTREKAKNGNAAWCLTAQRVTDTSLNSQLEAGPPIQMDLLRALLRFRRFRVGLQADIENMYLQVQIREEDRDACRFLWRDETQE